ncbi:membrane protein insertase YidC [soil metagenome]
MDNSNNQNQSRFLIAAILSMVVLFGWSYLFNPPPPPPADPNANVASNTNTNNAPSPAAPAPVNQAPPETALQTTPDTTPNRQITIRSPLYEVTLDSRGALATSWILLKNKSNKGEIPLYADSSSDSNQKPLQLISQEALNRTPRVIPFRLSTGDQNVTNLVNDRNYQVSTTEDTITLDEGQEQQIDFTLTDASGVEVKKTFVFRADSYITDLSISLRQNGQLVPDTKLLIGASIGDHAINHHTFYQIESEAVAAIEGDIHRHQGNYSFTFDANNNASLTVPGSVDWAGVSDSYFAMAAIPATPKPGLELRASKYEVETEPFFYSIFSWIIRSAETKETRHLVTAHVPINADGSVTRIYTGSKDYFLISSLGQELNQMVGRELEFINLINFSNYAPIRWFVKPISIPILIALNFINSITHNYGVAIIVFTFLFYSLLFPLRWYQSKSFKKAAGNAPKMKAIQEKIKDLQKKGIPTDDPRMRELQMQQLKMTKDALPIGGCLPMLLQFPLLIAFYTAVTVSLEVRQASFIWLPDLSAADPWHLIEFAFAISMILAMKFTPQAATITPEQQMQQKMMIYLMPVMMLWVMWAAPSGLLLYWFCGNIVSFGQQMLINRMNKTNVPPGTEIVNEVPANAKKVKPKFSTA